VPRMRQVGLSDGFVESPQDGHERLLELKLKDRLTAGNGSAQVTRTRARRALFIYASGL
jgi:hypothetical protein